VAAQALVAEVVVQAPAVAARVLAAEAAVQAQVVGVAVRALAVAAAGQAPVVAVQEQAAGVEAQAPVEGAVARVLGVVVRVPAAVQRVERVPVVEPVAQAQALAVRVLARVERALAVEAAVQEQVAAPAERALGLAAQALVVGPVGRVAVQPAVQVVVPLVEWVEPGVLVVEREAQLVGLAVQEVALVDTAVEVVVGTAVVVEVATVVVPPVATVAAIVELEVGTVVEAVGIAEVATLAVQLMEPAAQVQGPVVAVRVVEALAAVRCGLMPTSSSQRVLVGWVSMADGHEVAGFMSAPAVW
jgi:hypothetical protein